MPSASSQSPAGSQGMTPHDRTPAAETRAQALSRWLQRPAPRVIWRMLGACAGLALALAASGPPHTPFLLASFGGTAVFLFGLTSSPAGQPRAVFGGHLGGALIGIACGQALGDSHFVCALALSLTLGFMFATRTVHPPAGANPIIMVTFSADWMALIQPVLVGMVCLTAVVVVWSRLYPGLARYPVALFAPSPPSLTWGA